MIAAFLIIVAGLLGVVGYVDYCNSQCENAWIEVDHCRNDERTLEACKSIYLPEHCKIEGEDSE